MQYSWVAASRPLPFGHSLLRFNIREILLDSSAVVHEVVAMITEPSINLTCVQIRYNMITVDSEAGGWGRDEATVA